MISRDLRVSMIAFAIGLGGVGALGVVLASTPKPPRRVVGSVDSTRSAAEDQRERRDALVEGQRLLRRADSLRRILARQDWRGDSLLVLADTRLPALNRDVYETLLRRSWAGITSKRGDVRVAVAIVRDTQRFVPLSSSSILPTMLDGRTCLVVLSVSDRLLSFSSPTPVLAGDILDESRTTPRRVSNDVLNWQSFTAGATRASLGPCGWLAAYGAPGAGMRAWLDSTGWRAAEAARFIDTPRARAPWRSTRVERSPFAISPVVYRERSLGLPVGSCANGDILPCERLMFSRRLHVLPWRDSGVLTTGDFHRTNIEEGFSGSTRFLDPRRRFLDDLRRTIGHDRMGTLWRDSRAFPEAFAAVVGEPLGLWTSRWMDHSVREPGTRDGPAPSLEPWASALPIAAFFLWGAVRTSRRRQVGR